MRLKIKTKFLAVLLLISFLIITTLSVVHYLFELDLVHSYTEQTSESLKSISLLNDKLSNKTITPFTERYLQLSVDDIGDEIVNLMHNNNNILNDELIRDSKKIRILINKYSYLGNLEIVRIVVIGPDKVVLSIDPTEENKSYQHLIDRCPEIKDYIHERKNVAGYFDFVVDNKLTPVHLNVYQIPDTDYDVVAFLNLSKYLESSNYTRRKNLSEELAKLNDVSNKFKKSTVINIGVVSSIIIALILLVCFPISLFFATTVTKPIILLRNQVKKIGKGNFDVQIKEEGSLEVVDLIKSFNYLGKELQEYIKNLKTEITERQKVENDIKIAGNIQRSVLPDVTEKYKNRGFSLAAHLNSAKEASGDFYDFFYLDDDRLVITIADVSGKGIPAAFFMALSKTVLKNICESENDPAIALKKANNIISTDNKEFMFVTLFVMYYNFKTGEAEYANAGHHEGMILSDKNNKIEYFGKFNDSVIGFVKDFQYQKGKITFKKGETLVLYTDGITEAISPDQTPYGEKRLETLLLKTKSQPVDDMCSNVIKDVRKFENNTRFDDATIVMLRRD